MSLDRYNRIFNIPMAVIVFYTAVNLIYLITGGNMPLGELVQKLDSFTWFVYLIFAVVTLIVKVKAALKYLIGAKSTIINIIIHGVLSLVSVILVFINK